MKLLNDKTKFPIATLDIPIFEIDNYESPFKLSLTAIELGKYYWLSKDTLPLTPIEEIEPLYIGSFGK